MKTQMHMYDVFPSIVFSRRVQQAGREAQRGSVNDRRRRLARKGEKSPLRLLKKVFGR